MFRILFLSPLALLVTVAIADDKCWSLGNRWRTWTNIPCEGNVNNADPVARVFNGRLFVYTTWDDKWACGRRWNRPWWKKQGLREFCMPGYRVYSTANPTLRSGWYAHGPILREERVPWIWRGARGFKAAARMWALDVVRGQDGKYYMFFPAPKVWNDMRIGVAVANRPAGPFYPRRNPIPRTVGIDPSVVRLPNGQWVIFSSLNGQLYVQETNPKFTWVSRRKFVRGLKGGYKEGPHAEIRKGRLILFYSLSRPGIGYSIQQAVAIRRNRPDWGFWHAAPAITAFDGRTNHAFNVYFKGRNWIFYHRHMENQGARWSARKVVFSPVRYRNGYMRTIRPYWSRRRFNVQL